MKKERKDIKKKIFQVKLEEAANAVVYVLEEHDKRFRDSTMKKEALLKSIPLAIQKMRRFKSGTYVPTVENRQVGIAGASFVKNNWTEVCLKCAEYGYFVIWNPAGSLGIRLGTLEEYEEQQNLIFAVATGYAGFHNKRAQIIQMHGKESTDLHVGVTQHEGG